MPAVSVEVDSFLQIVRPVPWGVLGRQLALDGEEAERAPLPDAKTAYVDAAGLHHIQVKGPQGAGGSAGAIYRHLGIQDDDAFPAAVIESVQDELDAKLHRYRGQDGHDQQVLHAVGPDFRREPYASGHEQKAVEALSAVYCNVFREFANSGLPSLRLLPLSGGIFSGGYKEALVDMTVSALSGAFLRLGERERLRMLDASIELCIYLEIELDDYEAAFKSAKGTTRGGGWSSPQGLNSSTASAGEEQQALSLDQLSPEQRALALDPVIGDRPGTGHSQIRVEAETSPRRPAPDLSAAANMQALKDVVHKKRPGSARLSTKVAAEETRWPAPAPDPTPESDERLSLHFDSDWKAKTLQISPDHSCASWRKFRFGGFALSQEPLRKQVVGRWFEVQIEEMDTSRWSDGLGIGICRKPARESLRMQMDTFGNLEGFACELLPDHWMLGYDGDRAKIRGQTRYLTGAEMPGGRWKPADLREGDIVGVLITPDGHMLLFVNEELTIFAQSCEGLDETWKSKVFVALDLDGCIKTVKLLETNGAITSKVMQAHARFREAEHNARLPDKASRDSTVVQDL